MSRMSALLYLERSPKDLRALEIEIDKTLRPFLTESGWKRQSMRFDIGWMFDWLDFPSSDISKFITFDGPSGLYVLSRDPNSYNSDGRVEWSGISKEQKRSVHIDNVREICQFQTYLDTASLTIEEHDEIAEDGYVIFPDGSQYEGGKFQFTSSFKGKIEKQVFSSIIEIGSKEAVKRLLMRAEASLLLCTFHTRP